MPEIQFPAKLRPLFKPSRYKVLYGGRGGAKSWGVARALLALGASKPLRILCAREFQNSIQESVHRLLSDQINDMGLAGFYTPYKTAIQGRNGTTFGFEGLRHNVTGIKSYEGCDVCWVEEAQTVSRASWDVLVPTIRKPGSEIWITFNPELEIDETYQRFVTHPPTDSTVIKVNWSDNPWFPAVLRQEMEDLKARDYDSYLTVWEGHCRQALDGAVYANEIRAATTENRITNVPYDRTKPVSTIWDLGWSDNTSILFVQRIGLETRIIDHYSNRQQPLTHYQQLVQDKGYIYAEHWLPHDAQARTLATGKSVQEILTAAGWKVRIAPQLSITDGINAVRTMFPTTWIDSERCADFLHSIRHYRYDQKADARSYSREPLHDWSSHDADALRYCALSLRDDRPRKAAYTRERRGSAWAI